MLYTVKELFLIEFSIGFFFFSYGEFIYYDLGFWFWFSYFSSFCRKGGIWQVVSHIIWFPVFSFLIDL